MNPQEIKQCMNDVKGLHDRFKTARNYFSKFLKWLNNYENEPPFELEKAEKENLQGEIFFRNLLDELEGQKVTKQKILEFFKNQQDLAIACQELAYVMQKDYIYTNLYYQYILDPEPIQQSSLALKKCKEIFPKEVTS